LHHAGANARHDVPQCCCAAQGIPGIATRFCTTTAPEQRCKLENNEYIRHCFSVIFFVFHEISSFLLTAKTLTPKVFLRRDFPDVTMLQSSNH
jgi:hypothetical protein